MRCLVIMIATLATVVVAKPLDAREWLDSTGKHRIDAVYVEVVEDKVKLKREDGKEILVPLNRLSEKDQQHVRELQKKDDSEADSPESKVPEADREHARELIEQAYHLFKLDPKGNAKLISSKLKEAGRLNPHSIRAEFIRGLLNLLVAFNPREAQKNFGACLKRAPNNVAVLNNLAVTEVKLHRYREALQHWQQVREIDATLPFVSHNLGRLLKVHNDEKLVMPKADADRCADLYTSAVSKKLPATDPKVGWILMDFVEAARTEEPAVDPDLPTHIASGGTGFVVKGDYIVTNRHVVKEAEVVKIKVPNRSGVRDAQVIAISKAADLAVLRCEGLGLESVPLGSNLPRRGSDVMVLGFPQFDQLGSTLKSTRGAITSLPCRATENMMLVDAEMNSGNSGGPIANNKGVVVAVATAVFKPVGGTGGKYGAGIPIVMAMSFLRQHIPNLQPSGDAHTDELSWPDVDEKVSKSTVLILIEATDKSQLASAGGSGIDGKAIPFQDPTCPACNGTKILKKGFKRIKCPHCRGLGFDLDVLGIKVVPNPTVHPRPQLR